MPEKTSESRAGVRGQGGKSSPPCTRVQISRHSRIRWQALGVIGMLIHWGRRFFFFHFLPPGQWRPPECTRDEADSSSDCILGEQGGSEARPEP